MLTRQLHRPYHSPSPVTAQEVQLLTAPSTLQNMLFMLDNNGSQPDLGHR